ncbi:acyl-CoA carboxylase epsilon subunit [Saccharothrix sp. HUAS TT1]|uniref:acyl-CoA carboxylase epsilon subunit n=1 Tax=unclassified Saccharothrix TaxID=2593673 RepID=UPI00345C5808
MTGAPFLRVDRGEPSPEELAAVAVALHALHALSRAEKTAPPPTSASTWTAKPYRAPGAWN